MTKGFKRMTIRVNNVELGLKDLRRELQDFKEMYEDDRFGTDAEIVELKSRMDKVEKCCLLEQDDDPNRLLLFVNEATASQLMALPHIGISSAEKIIQNRPYAQISDVQLVKGIGERIYSSILDNR